MFAKCFPIGKSGCDSKQQSCEQNITQQATRSELPHAAWIVLMPNVHHSACGRPTYYEARHGELRLPVVLQIDTTSARFQLRFVASGLSMEFSTQLIPEPVLKMRGQDANGTKLLAESLILESCAANGEWTPTRWSFTLRSVDIEVCGYKAEHLRDESWPPQDTTAFSLLVGAEDEALWSVCVE